MGEHAIQAWINVIVGTDKILREALEHKLRELLADFARDGDSSLEQLMTQRVIATWLHVQHADARYAQAGNTSERVLEFLARRQSDAQKRHLAAIKSLVSLRKLLHGSAQQAPSRPTEQPDIHAAAAMREPGFFAKKRRVVGDAVILPIRPDVFQDATRTEKSAG